MFEAMKTWLLIPVVLAVSVSSAGAQVRSWTPLGSAGASSLETQRYAIELQRQQAEAAEALARQQQLQTRLTLMELQSRRIPAPTPDVPIPALRSPEQERAAREAATARRQATAQGVGQIDNWLDRPPQ
ncbi:hypothetical protein [Brevundimonas goettingensis]|uniref:Uncharacterized protein n=1 Tax=Brevundimonas goettingensis TaxID=2774190 RepID=A0A975C293_9CAUL|nr:hypothetical protein [Brevundimonas goettingensis]QTC91517.1 hypothetical protein IFJ75_00845 [Brevundimonas goettingensis]